MGHFFGRNKKDGCKWGYFVAATKMGTMDGDFLAATKRVIYG